VVWCITSYFFEFVHMQLCWFNCRNVA